MILSRTPQVLAVITARAALAGLSIGLVGLALEGRASADAAKPAAPAPAAAPAPVAAPAAPFPPVAIDWANAIWGDGEDLIAVASGGATRRICRSGQVVVGPGIYVPNAVTGAGVGGDAVIAVAGSGGKVVQWAKGLWEQVTAPVSNNEDLVAAAVDARGRAYFAGETSALYVHDGATWATHRYPSSALGKVTSIAVGPNDAVYVAGEGSPDVLELRGGALQPLAAKAVPPLQGGYLTMWMSPRSGRLWLTSTSGALVSINVATGEARSYKIPLFGSARALTGVATPKGDLLVVGAQSEFALFDSLRFTTLERSITFPEGLYVDVRGSALYVASRDGFQRVPLVHPFLAAAQAALPAPAAGASVCAPDVSRPAATEAATQASPPPSSTGSYSSPSFDAGSSWSSSAGSSADSSSSSSSDDDEISTWPTLRPGFGFGIQRLTDGGVGSSFNFDLLMGARVGMTPRFAIWPEVGYSLSTAKESGGNFLTAGVGPFFGTPMFGVGLTPRLVLGEARGQFGIGVRSSVTASAVYDLFSVELSHQWLRAGGVSYQEGRAMFAVDVTPVVGFFLAWSFFGSFLR